MNGDDPLFLTRPQVESIHARSLARFGGTEGVREPGLVESALASAQNTWWYAHGDLFAIAATYAYHFAESQAFLDGNKRTAIGSALTFLELNGVTIPPNEETLYDAMIAIAEKRMDKAGLAALFRHLAGSP
ncbi:MAG: type II toxin-antitoxin system death-on-curing family toxin [Verrucomicrobia bacterium]|nr:type II toxin-antitoxin system death-on-curing family toxin [Verrucomicrobiota bacterium]